MFEQSQILRTLSAAHSRMRLDHILTDKSLGNRAAIVRRVCAEFGFLDVRQQLQVAGCAKALSKLADRGCIVLPAPMNTYAAGAGPCLLPVPVPAPHGLPDSVRAVQGLSVRLVTEPAPRAIWNTLLHAEHPRGVTTFCGAQVRYLVHSAHGYLGGGGLFGCGLAFGLQGGLDGLDGGPAAGLSVSCAVSESFSDSGPLHALGQSCVGLGASAAARRYGGAVWVSSLDR